MSKRKSAAANARQQRRKVARRRELVALGRIEVPHGVSGYSNYGCRCSVCSAAHGRNMAAGRVRRGARSEAAPHGTAAGYSGWGCRCEPCSEANSASQSVWSKARNEKSREVAHHHGHEWTGPELEVAARRELSASEVARMLGRTIAAVNTQRKLLNKEDPRRIALLGTLYR